MGFLYQLIRSREYIWFAISLAVKVFFTSGLVIYYMTIFIR
jgi:hypothetical protein